MYILADTKPDMPTKHKQHYYSLQPSVESVSEYQSKYRSTSAHKRPQFCAITMLIIVTDLGLVLTKIFLID